MLIGIEIIGLLMVVVYGGNYFLYRSLQKKTQIEGLEKLAIFFGINMLILLFSGSVIVFTLLVQ
ncbi:hypothetical protein LI951_08415 [Enterococcus sp. BWT-B8]|uniref:hypothetical protein n=1 Tax=Enterococcus sp. BWT-B8 TaxID=2885157 RepID=UPI001E5E4E47|nr:hypothetical protein [Enterococcus sp. BWT-B8]MCB5952086.1 hypothetical protein [Enterococcus sp. BWT-B8]